MQGRVLSISGLSDVEIEKWRDLAAHALQPNPVFEPECLLPAARYLPGGHDMYLVVAEQDDVFHACMPVALIPGGARMISALSWPRLTSLTTQVRRLRYDGTPLVREEESFEAVRVLLAELEMRGGTLPASLLRLEAIDADGPLLPLFRAAGDDLGIPWVTLQRWVRPIVHRRETRLYRDSESHAFQSDKKLAKLRRQLSAAMGGDVTVVDRSGDPYVVDQLVTLEASGAKLVSNVAMAAHAGESEWFIQMCNDFRDEGRLVVYALENEGSVAAVQLMIRAGDGLFGIHTVYDSRFARFSPGIQLHAELLQRFHDDTNALWHDTCTFARNETLLKLYPDRREVATLVFALGNSFSRALLRLYRRLHRQDSSSNNTAR